MKVSEINLTTSDIEKMICEYNEDFFELTTKINILSRVLQQCDSESEHTLI